MWSLIGEVLFTVGALTFLVETGALPLLPSQYPDYHPATYFLPPFSLLVAYLIYARDQEQPRGAVEYLRTIRAFVTNTALISYAITLTPIFMIVCFSFSPLALMTVASVVVYDSIRGRRRPSGWRDDVDTVRRRETVMISSFSEKIILNLQPSTFHNNLHLNRKMSQSHTTEINLAHPPPPNSTLIHRTRTHSIFSLPSGSPIVIRHILPRTVTIAGRVYNTAALYRHHDAITLLAAAGPATDLPPAFSCSEAISPWWSFPLLQEDVERERAADAACMRRLMTRWVGRSREQDEEEEEAEPAGANFIYAGEGFYGGEENGGNGQSQDGAEVAAPASVK
ncbi:hypothetical protein CMUS01_06117 [Colletotrichum musicola]|uniref:Uncharacterized protein n=1 Tax=Colletotrichum musicola TaxID=2175873 RepID=A0A8H6KNS8_9PEZI|nr:hypothetical protein CMUS01_06117 [Colletotrichum musicola]